MNDFPQQLRSAGNAHRHDGVAGLRRCQLMADGADAADARSNARHLVIRAAFGELLEAAHLSHLELGVGYFAIVIELNGDLAVALNAAYRLNYNALHRRSLSKLDLRVCLGLAALQQVVQKSGNHLVLGRAAGKTEV